MSSTSSPSKTWLITGTSQGFGRELVAAALQRGDRVVATSRSPEKVRLAFPDAGPALLPVAMDLSDAAHIAAVVDQAIQRFGQIDVLVNNAGFGVLGALEEVPDEQLTRVFEINVFGLVRVIRAVLPHMRKRRSGHIVNLSSVGGLVGLPGWGAYNATKFAVEGLSEALAQELKPLGIGVTIVEPGPFRTDFLGGSLSLVESHLSDYAETAGKTREYQQTSNGAQAGDPVRAAHAIIDAVTGPNPPLHLLLGALAHQRATKKLDDLRSEFQKWRDVTLAADFPK